MIHRCADKNNPYYGGRGITVCERWKVFQNFVADMGDPPAATSLERRDNNGPYSPENCYWATSAKQSTNRRTTRLVTLEGKTLPATLLARELGIHPATFLWRLDHGWTLERAAIPPTKSNKKTY